MTAGAFALQVLAIGGAQVGRASLLTLIVAMAFMVPVAVAIRVLKRRTRITHLVPLPPAEEIDLPDLPRGGPELADDVNEIVKGWAAEWEKQKGDRRD